MLVALLVLALLPLAFSGPTEDRIYICCISGPCPGEDCDMIMGGGPWKVRELGKFMESRTPQKTNWGKKHLLRGRRSMESRTPQKTNWGKKHLLRGRISMESRTPQKTNWGKKHL